MADSVRVAEAWGHRIGQELRTDENKLATMGSVFAQLDSVQAGLFSSVADTSSSDGSITATAWAPELTVPTLDRVLKTYPNIDRRLLADRLQNFPHLFPIVMAAGISGNLQQGLDLTTQAPLAAGVERALNSGGVATCVVSEGNQRRVILLTPVNFDNGEGRGILAGELDLSKLMARARGDLAEPLSLSLEASDQGRIWSDGNNSSQGQEVASVPIQVGDQRWSAEFSSPQEVPAIHWEAALAGLL